jgi:hypothetical protein
MTPFHWLTQTPRASPAAARNQALKRPFRGRPEKMGLIIDPSFPAGLAYRPRNVALHRLSPASAPAFAQAPSLLPAPGTAAPAPPASACRAPRRDVTAAAHLSNFAGERSAFARSNVTGIGLALSAAAKGDGLARSGGVRPAPGRRGLASSADHSSSRQSLVYAFVLFSLSSLA